MSRHQRITDKLTTALQPTLLELRDISHTHAGHAGTKESGGIETHFTLRIASTHFVGLSRVAQHQLVNAALADEFQTGLHALAITIINLE